MKSLALFLLATVAASAEPISISGIYPGLAMFNNEGECGTGAVVPWAGRLWVVTYAPHMPKGSSDKLYEISESLVQTIRPESIGGTPANRMIHRESNQLFIGPYAIDAEGKVRTIPYAQMFGRPTGNARHLTDPAGKIYYATMEEGIYEVDVKSLAVTELWRDEQVKSGRHADLPGYHGKGFYSGFGQLFYANNGDHAKAALTEPSTPSGVLAAWDGKADAWSVVRRNQFTDITGPGGIFGNDHPESDPVWSIGWDHRSLILMLCERGKWTSFRLPKASRCYDGAHGWNTEWPRIREIGAGDDLMMTMHGMFWHFPRTFSSERSAGIAPRSTYLKVVGDFCRWGDRVVLGCDDTAKSEFLNKRKVKGTIEGPGQSQSNLRFLKPEQLDGMGPPVGSGAVWQEDAVKRGEPSDPFLFAGFARRGLHLWHDAKEPVHFTLEMNAGDGRWMKLRDVSAAPGKATWVRLDDEQGAWVRVISDHDLSKATAVFHYSNEDKRASEPDAMFASFATAGAKDFEGGLVRTRGANKRSLAFAAMSVRGGKTADAGYYELDDQLKLRRVEDAAAHAYVKKTTAIPVGVITVDEASVLVVDDRKRRWRLPKGDAAFDAKTTVPLRVCREVCTERDLFNVHGSFYELPAENAGGFERMRPICTHNRSIHDYCSYRGLLIMTGLDAGAKADGHVIRSDDGKAALWAGAVDDLWHLGKAVGHGGPWKDTAVKASQASDAYLMTNYDRKQLSLSASKPVKITVQVDALATGAWQTYATFEVDAGKPVSHEFPAGFNANWVRFVVDADCVATAELVYQ